jgi:hypothetical protein
MIVIFLAYYSPEQYKLLLKYADDREKIEDKWEDWLVNYIKAKNDLSKELSLEEFHVDVEKMQNYFKSKKLKNTSKNRAEYVSRAGSKEYERNQNN